MINMIIVQCDLYVGLVVVVVCGQCQVLVKGYIDVVGVYW